METAVTIGDLGKTVCIISAEDFCEMAVRFGRSFPPENSITEVIHERGKIRSCSFEVSKNVFFLGPSYTDSALNLHFTGAEAKNLLEVAKELYDYVIVDCTTWKANALTGTALSMASIIFMPIPAKTTAKMWLTANHQTIRQHTSSIVYVQNITHPTFDFKSLLKTMPDVNIKIRVPFIADHAEMVNNGKLICRDSVSGKNISKYREAICQLIH